MIEAARTFWTTCHFSRLLILYSLLATSETSRMIAKIDPTPQAQPSTLASHNTLSKALALHKTTRSIKPVYHPQWKLMRVISGHLGWVRSVAVEPGNKWFATGAGDRVIKIWDLASGELKLSLTGHISTVRGLAVSPRHPYLFSCGEDKVRCPFLVTLPLILRCESTDGQVLGPRSEQSHPTLPRSSLGCIHSKLASDTRRPRNSRPRCISTSMGHANKGPHPRTHRAHRNHRRRQVPGERSTGHHR